MIFFYLKKKIIFKISVSKRFKIYIKKLTKLFFKIFKNTNCPAFTNGHSKEHLQEAIVNRPGYCLWAGLIIG
jgi:hypothetical protein